MKSLKYILSFISFIACVYFANILAQNFKVQYEVTNKYNTEENLIRKMNYILDIQNAKSVFRTDHRKLSDSLISTTGYGLGYNRDPHFELYFTKDLENRNFKKFYFTSYSDIFFIKINDELQWKILSETDMIAGFHCQKAEVKYGGRYWTAWFTSEVITSEGPYFFHGLPGLIVQIEDSKKDFVFKATQIVKNNKNSLFAIKEGAEISWKNYTDILKSNYQDPFGQLKLQGLKVFVPESTEEVDYNKNKKLIQESLRKNNNPIELSWRINYEQN